MQVHAIKAREVLDSRGNPTVEVDLFSKCGLLGRAIVPSGASTGEREALEVRDTKSPWYNGKGVKSVLAKIENEIFPAIQGLTLGDQRTLDALLIKLDGTPNKSRLGANGILAVSMAYAQLSARAYNMPLFQYLGGVGAHTMPVPMANVLNGGSHADNNLDFQEFMLIPTGASNFADAMEWLTRVFHTLRGILKEQNYVTGVGDEGGFAPNLKSNEEALELLMKAIEKAGFKAGVDFCFALDVASSEFYNKEKKIYKLHKSSGAELTSSDMVAMYADLIARYPIISIEDGMAENDWDGWKLLTDALKPKGIQIVGDDLFVTNPAIFKEGIDKGIANSILIKINQIGTITETMDAVHLAQKYGYNTVASHRSGESEDCFIADLAVGLNMGQIKTGSMSRSDRMAKYNQLLRIQETLGANSLYEGRAVFQRLK